MTQPRRPAGLETRGLRRSMAQSVRVGVALGRALVGRRFEGATPWEFRLIARALWSCRSEREDPLSLFDAAFYLEGNPEVGPSGLHPLVHYLRHGASRGLDPHPLFDSHYYLECNPDVAERGLNPLIHYLRHGASEGRDPHPLFDSAFYARGNPDILAGLNPLLHFVSHGAAERRSPHPLFDSDYYLECNPDVAESGLNPLIHYLQDGAGEGRDPHPLFDSAFYLRGNPDILAAGLNPLLHFVRHGAAERRSPHPLFDTAFYLEAGSGGIPAGDNPLVHYLRQAAVDGGDPHPLFSTRYYCSRYVDVVRAGFNPLVHYVRHGAFEGRRPHPLFDPAFYVLQARDERGRNPGSALVHYLERGTAESCSPHPFFDTSFYASRYRDEIRVGGNPLVHFVREGAAAGLLPVPEATPGTAQKGPPEPVPTASAERSGWLSNRVAVVAMGSAGEPAADWVTRLVSTAEPARVEVAGLGLPLRFPACANAVSALAGQGTADYLFLVTGSLQPERGWLEPLLQAFTFLPRVGAVCSSVLAGALANGSGEHGSALVRGAARSVEGLSSGGVLVPRELFLRVGGLDPAASSYDEAVHRLADRLRARGFEVYVHPHSRLLGEPVVPVARDRLQRHPVLFAAVTGRPWADPGTATADVVVAALRLFSASGWRVLVWPRGWPEDTREHQARAWEALGLDVAAEWGDRFPPEFAESGRADAILLDRAADRALVARFLAVQPQARLLLVSGPGPFDDRELLEYFDGVISPGRELVHFNHLDLGAVLSGDRAPASDGTQMESARAYCFGSGVAVDRTGLRELLAEAQVASGVPVSLAEAGSALGVIALGADRCVETEAVREALARGIPVFATPTVKAAAGADELEVTSESDRPPELVRRLVPALDRLGIHVRRLGPPSGPASRRWPWTLAHRSFTGMLRRAGLGSSQPRSAEIERLAREAAVLGRTDADFVLLGLISWHYRYQRPQHLSAALGRRRKRVIYVEPTFLPGTAPQPYRLEENPAENVFCATLRVPGPIDINRAPPTAAQVPVLAEGLLALSDALALDNPTLILQAPFWLPVCRSFPRTRLVYDSMDLYGSFHNVTAEVVELEKDLFRSADLVVFTAAALQERTRPWRSEVIRNGCEFSRFAGAEPSRVSDRVTVGYVGAIESWFDVELVNQCVESRPEWDFVLAGAIHGLPAGSLRARPNLRLLGEIDYSDVPGVVAGFDVCLVPFLENDLTRCVNPVKVYEYLAAGKPVVATALPELLLLEPGLVHLASSLQGFLEALPRAVAECRDPVLKSMRRDWAARQTWGMRAEELLKVLAR